MRPDLYEIRVQVVDPQGRPVTGSTVHTSAGNEPHLLPDGWWEVQVPAVKMPADGQISLRADHPEWEGNEVKLRLGEDPNPRAEIHLKPPASWIRGIVVDGKDRLLEGVRVSREDGGPEAAVTDSHGRFELRLAKPREMQVRLRAERADLATRAAYCYTGRDNCSIVLGEP